MGTEIGRRGSGVRHTDVVGTVVGWCVAGVRSFGGAATTDGRRSSVVVRMAIK